MSNRPIGQAWNRRLRLGGTGVIGLGVLGVFVLLAYSLMGGQGGEAPGPGDPGNAEAQALNRQIEKARIGGLYILVDTARNRLYLRKGGEILMEAVCSTGSGVELVSADKKWTFRTPRGAFRVISKTRNPVWRRPDWAFLEEGEPVPKKEGDRFERGVLGKYALGIGDGYFIHGTLYPRLLGTNVTHGCIRLGGDDLAALAKKVPIGTKVFIY